MFLWNPKNVREGLGRTKTDYEAIERRTLTRECEFLIVFIENCLILGKIIHKYYTYNTYNNERGHKKLPYTRVGIFFDTLLFF